jgi:hypothetical protein
MSEAREYVDDDDSIEITPEEDAAIRSLERLAKKWPRSLTLASMGGSLVVYHTDDERMSLPNNTQRVEAVIASIIGIPNDGGDW